MTRDRVALRAGACLPLSALLLLLRLAGGPVPLAAQQEGQISGVVVAAREDAESRETLLVEVPGSVGEREVDEVRIELPRGVAVSDSALRAPDGWVLDLDGRRVVLTGPPGPASAHVKLRVTEGRPPESVKVTLYAEGRKVAEGRVAVPSLPPVRPLETFEELLAVPPVVHAGESVIIRPLASDRTPSAGTWTVGGVPAVHIKHSSLVAEGESVFAAGHIEFQGGKPVSVDAVSGHFFQEAPLMGDEAAAWVRAMGELFEAMSLPAPGRIIPGVP